MEWIVFKMPRFHVLWALWSLRKLIGNTYIMSQKDVNAVWPSNNSSGILSQEKQLTVDVLCSIVYISEKRETTEAIQK